MICRIRLWKKKSHCHARSLISGAQEAELAIETVTPKDQGTYQCSISNPFGETLTKQVNLKVNPATSGEPAPNEIEIEMEIEI